MNDMTEGAWLVIEGDEIPAAWRSRARRVTLVPLMESERNGLLLEGGTAPALEPIEENLLGLLGIGLRTRDIARRTGVPERSVQRRLARLRRQLGTRTNAELAVLAARLGLGATGDAAAPMDDAGNRGAATKSFPSTNTRRKS